MKSAKLAQLTYRWYSQNKRDLPWRQTKDPYKIWVSEVMSQQTQLERVVPYYERFIAKLPTVTDLALVDEATLLKLWEGLGYYSRVRNMQKAANVIIDEFAGVFPSTYESLLKLSGVGPYIAGAIAGICFNERVSAVDGNVIRLFSRVYEIKDDVREQKTIKQIQNLAQEAVKTGVVGDINQGFIELGALVCTPKNPKCLDCPLKTICTCFAEQTVGAFPYKSPTKKQKEYDLVACIIEDSKGNIYVEQRQMELLHHQWQLPMFEEVLSIDTIIEQLKETLQADVVFSGEQTTRIRHVFSHQVWNLKAYYLKMNQILSDEHVLKSDTHLITAHKKVLEKAV